MSVVYFYGRRIRLPGSTAKWENVCSTKKKIIQVFLGERDGFVCHYCNVKLVNHHCMGDVPHYFHPNSGALMANLPRDVRWAVIDHKTPVSKGGTNDLENLALACRDCNTRKNARGYFEFLQIIEAEEMAVAR